MALSQAVGALPGVEERHLHALFRFLDTTCTGALPPDNLADVIYGPPKGEQIVAHAWQVRHRCVCRRVPRMQRPPASMH